VFSVQYFVLLYLLTVIVILFAIIYVYVCSVQYVALLLIVDVCYFTFIYVAVFICFEVR